MLCALIPFNLPVVFGSAMLWLEISTYFIAFRWMMFFNGIMGGDWRQNLNSFFIVTVFIFCRTIFQLYAVVVVGMPFLYKTFFKETGNNIFYQLLILEFFFAVVINVIMNVYWT